MVSFQCNGCEDIFAKPKIKKHLSRCPTSSFSCLDCHKEFSISNVHDHTECISEDTKFQGYWKTQNSVAADASKTKVSTINLKFPIQIRSEHVKRAANTVGNSGARPPKLKMLTRHALHTAFLEQLKKTGLSFENDIKTIAVANNIDFSSSHSKHQ